MKTNYSSSIEISNIEFILKENDQYANDLNGCILITGFYGIGKIGFIAVNHMIEKLKAELIGTIITDYVPPFISVKNKSLISPFQIYRAGKLIFLIPYFEPYKYEQRAFTKAVTLWALQEGIKQMILIGGLDSRLRSDENILTKAVYTKEYKNSGETLDIPLLDDGIYVSGPLALLLLYCEVYNLPAIALLSYAERSRPDPVGASHAVAVVSDLVKTNCGVEELIKEAENIENEISAMMDASENPINEDFSNKDADKGLFM